MTKSKFTRSINHISKVKEWDSYQPKDAKTLILGNQLVHLHQEDLVMMVSIIGLKEIS